MNRSLIGCLTFLLAVWSSVGAGIFMADLVFDHPVTHRRRCWRALVAGPLVWVGMLAYVPYWMIRESDAWRQFNAWLDAK